MTSIEEIIKKYKYQNNIVIPNCNINEFKEFIYTQYIKAMLSTENNSIQKSHNEINAKLLEKKLVEDTNNKKGYYTIINNEFNRVFNKDITHVERIGEKKHFDLRFTFMDGTTKRCEVKSSHTKCIDNWTNPWDGAVQFLNGTGNKFRIINVYAKSWYEKMPLLKEQFNLKSPIPEYNEWIRKDASPQKAQTDFGIELHDMSKENKDALKKYKSQFVKELVVPEKDVNELIEDYIRESKKVLDEKDCWLCVGTGGVKLFDKIESETITNLTRNFKSKDLYYNIDSDIFKGIRIRWQNGVGIANISVQCT